jgi:DNA (cytosine-5)-methyltransferase 1
MTGPGLRYGSVFSGIGGFDLGFDRAGMSCAFQVEVDANCRAVLGRHWPGVRKLGDITEVNRDQLEEVDVLCGGFPCQDVSVAGRRAGLEGARSSLFWEFVRLARELQPAWLVIENVPGLLSSGGRRDMGTVLGALGELGYGFAYRVLDARHFGVAQRRRRVFIAGHLGGSFSAAAAVLLEPEGGGGHPTASNPKGQDVAGTLGGGSSSGGPGHDLDRMTYLPFTEVSAGGWRPSEGTWLASHEAKNAHTLLRLLSPETAAPLSAERDGYNDGSDRTYVPETGFALAPGTRGGDAAGRGDGTDRPVAAPLTAGGHPNSSAPGRRREDDENLVAWRKAQKAHDASDSERWEPTDQVDTLSAHGTTSASAITYAIDDGRAVESPHGPGARPGPSYPFDPAGAKSIAAGATPPVSDSVAVRRLTPLECERLQGFPDGWTGGQSDSARYRELGNAVCVPVARWIGSRIVAVDAALAGEAQAA